MFLVPISTRRELNIRMKKNQNEIPDEELNDIFLSENSHKYKRQVTDPNFEKKDKKLDHLLKKNTVKLKRSNLKEEKPKRPRGRPKKWTDEKLAQLKAEKKSIAKEKRNQRKNLDNLTKIALGQNLGPAAQKRIAETALETKKNIDSELVYKRKIQQKLNKVTIFEKNCNHLDAYAYSSMDGTIVSSCRYCSRLKNWQPREWSIYHAQTKQEL